MKLPWFFDREVLRPVEKRVLESVAEALPQAPRELFVKQVNSINRAQRLTHGREVNLYRIRKGKPDFDDSLRFPVTSPEVRLATVEFVTGQTSPPLRCDVWLANGRVFSLLFNRSIADEQHDTPASTTVWVDPTADVTEAKHVAPQQVREWFGDLSSRVDPDSIQPPLVESDTKARFGDWWDQLPDDAKFLYAISGGLQIGEWKVLGPLGCREIVTDAGNFLVLADGPDASVLALSREPERGPVYLLGPNAVPKPMTFSLRDSIAQTLSEVAE